MAVKIQFAQGVNVGNVGEALVGSAGASVVASDGNASPGAVSHYRWTWIDVPTLSTLPLGLITEGPVSNVSFVPDVAGDYHLMVEAFSVTGFKTVDRRVFRVELASTRALPAFDAEADALNFGGQTRGWKPDMEKWLLYLEALVSPGMSSSGSAGAVQVAGVTPGTFATPTNLFAGSSDSFPWIAWASASNVPSSGALRFPYGASQILLHGRSALGVDRPILWQTTSTLKFGDELGWALNVYGTQLAFWSRGAEGNFHGGTSGTLVAKWNENGWQFGSALDLAGGVGVRGLRAATTAPAASPSAGIVEWCDGADDWALKYKKPTGQIVILDRFVEAYDPTTNGFRLSAQSNTPLPLVDITGATVIYLTPFKSSSIALRTSGAGARWVLFTTTQVSLALSGLTSGKNYDVFAYWDGTQVQLELSAAWTNDTTRADAIARLNGVWVKDANVTRRYVGTFRATGTGTTNDTALQRFVWSVDNQLPKRVQWQNATDNWTVAGNAFAGWRPLMNSTSSAIEFVCGLPSRLLLAGRLFCGATSAGWVSGNGIGIDSTTVNSARVFGNLTPASGSFLEATTRYDDVVSEGYHKCYQLEVATGGGGPTVTFYGTAGSAAFMSTGLLGEYLG